jgi:primosomal protein N' (replication factor Y) (superfamily II helicase)
VTIARVAIDVPIDTLFDFRVPESTAVSPGALVVVPFGRSRKVGLVIALQARSSVAASRLRDIESVVADAAPLGPVELELLGFCARYYLRPLGEVAAAALPPRLRQVSRRALAATEIPRAPRTPAPQPPDPTPAQQAAIAACLGAIGRFQPILLQGVTGSGKTEVYLRAIDAVIASGKQALLLLPEIALTPQLESVTRSRFPQAEVVAVHSAMGEGARAAAWLAAQRGSAAVVLGTRLAVFMPFRDLALIVVDEEHDPSYKQQEGVRYSARDLAVRRAQLASIPVILGSATPSLESYANARDGRYAYATLPARVAGAALPRVRMVDTRADRPADGMTQALRVAIAARLEAREQSLVFINRRGFAPVLHCRDCLWHPDCPRCSAKLVVHRAAAQMRCHHCGHRERLPQACPRCGSADLAPLGEGTQRIEAALQEAFPQARIARLDRDVTRRRGALQAVLGEVRAARVDILVGTQMLTKGHDYPALTLVGVIGADGALFSADFRAAERLFSRLVQVAGRAGRRERRGEVIVQTEFPTHPLYAAAAAQDFDAFAAGELAQRAAAGFPPFSHLALLRAESKKEGEALAFARAAARTATRIARGAADIDVFDAVPALLERKAGFSRAQLMVRARARTRFQPFLHAWQDALSLSGARRVRWSIDVDPQET